MPALAVRRSFPLEPRGDLWTGREPRAFDSGQLQGQSGGQSRQLDGRHDDEDLVAFLAGCFAGLVAGAAMRRIVIVAMVVMIMTVVVVIVFVVMLVVVIELGKQLEAVRHPGIDSARAVQMDVAAVAMHAGHPGEQRRGKDEGQAHQCEPEEPSVLSVLLAHDPHVTVHMAPRPGFNLSRPGDASKKGMVPQSLVRITVWLSWAVVPSSMLALRPCSSRNSATSGPTPSMARNVIVSDR